MTHHPEGSPVDPGDYPAAMTDVIGLFDATAAWLTANRPLSDVEYDDDLEAEMVFAGLEPYHEVIVTGTAIRRTLPEVAEVLDIGEELIIDFSSHSLVRVRAGDPPLSLPSRCTFTVETTDGSAHALHITDKGAAKPGQRECIITRSDTWSPISDQGKLMAGMTFWEQVRATEDAAQVAQQVGTFAVRVAECNAFRAIIDNLDQLVTDIA